MSNKLLLVLFLLCSVFCGYGQTNNLNGYYSTSDYSLALRLKSMGKGEYHGTLQSIDGVFALKLNQNSEGVKGTVYTQTDQFTFSGSAQVQGLFLESQGAQYQFYKINNQHGLEGMDLEPYFRSSTVSSTENSGNNPSYSGSKGEAYQIIAGSQLVYYQRTSYVNDNTASSITYVNFCRNGQFSLNYDGGFSVEGRYGGNAQGASQGSNYGTWEVSYPKGQPSVTLRFANGQVNTNPVNMANLRSGRWRIGNTQYALVRNKVNCR